MGLPAFPFLKLDASGGVVIDVHAMPNANKTVVQGIHDGALHIRLKAPPVEGKANAALLKWLAAELEIPRSGIELLRGDKSRRKQCRVEPAYIEAARWEKLQGGKAPP
jgi:uncharacterized protein